MAQSTSTRNRLRSVAIALPSHSIYVARKPCSPGSEEKRFESPPDFGSRNRANISFSIANSRASGTLNPSPEKTLTPLSVHGLCDAEMTTPASNFRERARYATPGVVITPALCTSTPQEFNPHATRSAIQRLDSRVSWPMMTRGLGFSRSKSCPSALPIQNVLSWVSGNSPATPRIPSVPNSCLVSELIQICSKQVWMNQSFPMTMFYPFPQ